MLGKGLQSFLLVGLVICIVALWNIGSAVVQAEPSLQTWPSRTPTPRPAETRPPGGSEPPNVSTATPGGGGSTPVERSSPTSTAGVINQTIPAASPLPTSIDQPPVVVTSPPDRVDPCVLPPYVQALGPAPVTLETRADNETIGYLQFSERRTIIGRSNIKPWWLIQYDTSQQGWVSDHAVSVHGFIGAVPVVESGQESTAPASSWNPTPNPRCSQIEDSTATNLSGTLEPEGEVGIANNTPLTVPKQTPSSDQPSEAVDLETADQEDVFSDTNPDNGQTDGYDATWLLVTGLFLVIVGIIAIIVRRRSHH